MTPLLEISRILTTLVDILHNIEFFLKFTLYNHTERQDDLAQDMRVGTFQSFISVDATSKFTETAHSLFLLLIISNFL